MAEEIKDGTGGGYIAAVNEQNRLEVFATTEEFVADVSHRNGEAFILASDFVALTTTGSFNAIMYIKNNSDKDLYIRSIRVCGDGSGTAQIRLIRNPTSGTIVSEANLADQLSSNFGSTKQFEGLAYSASGDGKTLTDGDNFTNFINHLPGHSTEDFRGAVILKKGSSLGITCKPTIATNFCVEVVCWFK
jgi:hypothetical protein